IALASVLLWDTYGEKGSGLGKDFLYDLKELGKIDPALITYEESAQPLNSGLKATRAIAVGPNDDIYIAGDNAVSKVAPQGTDRIVELAEMPRCLAVTADGNIYVGLKDHIEIFDDKGKQIARWESLGEKALLTSIAVYENNVFAADAGNRIVMRYDTQGKLINTIGQKNTERNIPGFLIPSPYFDLAVGKDGLLRVVNPGLHRIEAYTFDGDLEFWWGRTSTLVEGFCGCCNPVNFAILDDRSFVTCEKGLVRVKIYDQQGEFVSVVAGPEQLDKEGPWVPCDTPEQCQTRGFDVAVDSKNNILVLDTVKSIVRTFTKIKTD
ncbi:MAG: NHL repeat-containing protein, partial [Planctomycetota bacterium]